MKTQVWKLYHISLFRNIGYLLFDDQVQKEGPDPLCDTLSGQIHHFELMKGLVCQGEHLHDLC